MPVTYEAANDLFRAGQFVQLVRSVAGTPAASAQITPSPMRVLVAHALFYLGHLEVARQLAQSDYQLPSVHARAAIVLGLVDKRTGYLDAAVRHFQEAARLARDANDVSLEAWARLYLFRLLLEGQTQQDVAVVLRELQQCVIRAADPHLAAYLHNCVAVLETQTGHFDEANRHLVSGTALLQRYPNAWLQQTIEIAATSLACLQSN